MTEFKEWVTTDARFSIKESFVDENGQELVKVEAFVLPWNKISRNGIMYNRESFESNLDKWENVPIMYNHLVEGDALPLGKVLRAWSTEEGMYHMLGIDPKEEKVLHKMKLGLLNKLSIHILPSKTLSRENYTEALFGSCVEESIVPSPGFMDTRMRILAERFTDEVKTMDEKPTDKSVCESLSAENKALTERVSALEKALTENKSVLENHRKVFSEAIDALEEIGEEDKEKEDKMDEMDGNIGDIVGVLQALSARVDANNVAISELKDILKTLVKNETESEPKKSEEQEPKTEDEQEPEDVPTSESMLEKLSKKYYDNNLKVGYKNL